MTASEVKLSFPVLLIGSLFVIGLCDYLQGPSFVVEPGRKVEFSNNSKIRVDCVAQGKPPPTIRWVLSSGVTAESIAGLRSVLHNGTLIFHPFRPEQYRQDVHANSYNCLASNSMGIILSRDVSVRAVVIQHYEAQVYDEFVISGNTGVVKCHIPSFVTDYVNVTEWIQENYAHPSRSSFVISNGDRFVVMPTGEMHVLNVTDDERMWSYRCRTYHRLTMETRISSTAGRLIVTAPQGSVPPRITDSRTIAEVGEGEEAFMPCAAQGYPVPSYRWFIKRDYDRLELVEINNRIKLLGGSLLIRDTRVTDAASYVCIVNNSIGSEKAETSLIVTAALMVTIQPEKQIVDVGNSAVLKCFISGYPVASVVWLKNGDPIRTDADHFSVQATLHISSLRRDDVGMYQCVVRNSRQVVHATAEIRIGDAPPTLHRSFSTQTVHPGSSVSLTCSVSGNPQPPIKWTLDDTPISNEPRIVHGTWTTLQGHSVGFLNISNVRTEDGGVYTCQSNNKLGAAFHSARLNVYGPPSIRPMRRLAFLAGSDAIIKCYYFGYPIEGVFWEKDSFRLPLDRRQRAFPNGTLQILNVQSDLDGGKYTCRTQNSEGVYSHQDVDISVLVPPGIVPFSFQGDQIVEGSRVRATCFVSKGDLPISITWLKDGRLLTSESAVAIRVIDEYSSILTVDKLTAQHSGNYTCEARNSIASVNYSTQLIVHSPPQWDSEPKDESVTVGSNATLKCSATGFPSPSIMWFKVSGTDYRETPVDNPRFQQLENGSLLLIAVQELDAGNYLCSASNGLGTGLNRIVHLYIYVPPIFEMKHRNLTLNKGEEARLSCEAYGDFPMSLTWHKDGQILPRSSYPSFRYTIADRAISRKMHSELIINRPDHTDNAVFSCTANNSYGRAESFLYTKVREPPAAPINVKLLDVKSRSLRLAWNTVSVDNSDLKGFIIQYKKSGDPWNSNSVSLAVANSESFATVFNLLPDNSYHFRMMAENEVGLSPPSEVIGVTTDQEAPGGPPQNVKVEATDSETLKVTWAAPKSELTFGDILGYNIGYKLSNSSDHYTYKKMDVVEPDRKLYHFFLSNLKKYVQYSVVVQAFNHHGNGPNAVEVVAITTEDVPSKPPRNVICSQMSPQSLLIKWEPPLPGDINGVLQGYKVVFRPLTRWQSGDVVQTVITTSQQASLHSLQVYTNYTVHVLAFTRVGDGVKSNPLICSTDEDVPDAPADIKALLMSTDSILVVWKPPIRSNGALTRYTIYARTLEGDGEVEINKNMVPSGRTYYEATKLSSRFRYEFWVTASTAVGEGKSTRVVAQALSSKVPAKIAAFDIQVITRWRNNVTLPCRVVGFPRPEVDWRVGGRKLSTSGRAQLSFDGSLIMSEIRDTDEGNYSCLAKNIHGADTVTYQLVVQAPPSPPNFVITLTTLNSVHLRWAESPSSGSPLIGYSLSYRREHGEWEELQLEPHVRSYVIDNLWCGTHHQLYMTAYSAIGPGKPSDIMTVKTRGSAPQVPSKDVILTTDASSVTLSFDGWSGDGCTILYFVVEYKKREATDWIMVSNRVKPQRERFIIEDLLPNVDYDLQVTAHNHAGSTASKHRFSTHAYSYDTATFMTTASSFAKESDIFPLYLNLTIILPVAIACVIIIIIVITVCLMSKRKREISQQRDLPDKYKAISNSANVGNSLQTSSNFCTRYHTSVGGYSNSVNQDVVNPYATFQFSEASPETSLSGHHNAFNERTMEELQAEQTSEYSRNVKHRSVQLGEHSFSDDTVPDLLYHNSSTSGDTSPDAANVPSIQVSASYHKRPPPTHAELNKYLKACRETEETSQSFSVQETSPVYLSDYYALPESDHHREKLMKCVKELESVMHLSSSEVKHSCNSMRRSESRANQAQVIKEDLTKDYTIAV